MSTMSPVPYKGDFIDGVFHSNSDINSGWQKHSPSDLSDLVFSCKENTKNVDAAVGAAKTAYKPWARLSLDERKNYLLRLKELFIAHKEDFAICIARETGKPLWEARGEAGALAGKIDITLNYSYDLVKETKIENAAPGADGYIRWRPRGVMAVIGPFNFPGHLPNGHIIPSLLTGNTVVFKPSEVTPATGQLMAEMYEKAEFPKGVFNLVQGKGDVGRRLVSHYDVDGVLFTGSYDTGLKISQEILSHYWKISALEMGGKNFSIVHADTDMDRAVYDNLFGAYASTGQRCSCTSKVFLHDSVYDQFLQRFHDSAKAIKIGHWRDDVFMGPLINEASLDKYIRFQEIAQREGAECVMRGKALDMKPNGYYVSPSIYEIKKHNPKSVYEQEEIFGPNVAVYKYSDIEEAFELANASSYGLSASVFSKDKEVYQEALINLNTGLVNWNRPTCGASSKLPFGGTKKSGNDRASGHFAVYYCTIPVASLEGDSEFDASNIATGIELK